jgi:splicing factor 3B subunit 1
METIPSCDIMSELKDEVKLYQKMLMETITKAVATLGASDIDEWLEIGLVDGIIYLFQEQTTEDQVMLDGFGMVVNTLGKSCNHSIEDLLLIVSNAGIHIKSYFTQIVSTIL